MNKILDDSQRTLDPNRNSAVSIHLPPEGYKGLSGFHKYWEKKVFRWERSDALPVRRRSDNQEIGIIEVSSDATTNLHG